MSSPAFTRSGFRSQVEEPLAGRVGVDRRAESHFVLRAGIGSGLVDRRLRALPGLRVLDKQRVCVVPALPAALAPLRALLAAEPGLEPSDEALAVLELLAAVAPGSTGLVRMLANDEGAWLAVTFEYSPSLVRGVKRIPGRAYDNDFKRWLAPFDPAAVEPVLRFLGEHPEVACEPELAELLSSIAEEAAANRVCSVEIEPRRGGEVFVVCRGCVEEYAGDALGEVHGLAIDYGRDAMLVPALPDSAWVVRAVLDGRPGIETGPVALARLEEIEEIERAAAELRALSRATDSSFDVPNLGGTLRSFQRAGVDYVLRTRRTFLADEQGLGKTMQALAALEADGAYPALVACPASLKLNWRNEIERWLPHRSVHVVGRRSDGGGAGVGSAEITIVNYEQLARREPALRALGVRALVFDESHFCKNPKAQRTKAARRLARGLDPESLVVLLTGTPLLNRPMELLPQLELIGRGDEFGGFGRFVSTYSGGADLDRLHRQLRGSCYVRRRKSEVLEQLPAKQRTVVPVELSNRAEYAAAEADVVAFLRERAGKEEGFLATLGHLEPHERRQRIRQRADDVEQRALRAEPLVRLNALKRIAARGKLRAATEWIETFLASGEKLVVYAHHRDALAGLLEAFPDAVHVLGDDQLEARQAAVDRFQEDPECRLIVCSQQAAGFGLTLTAASNVAFLELGWNPAVHDQAEDRIHRIGQREQVTAWYLLAANTVDEPIAELIEHKRSIVAAASDGETMSEKASVLGELVQFLVSDAPAPARAA